MILVGHPKLRNDLKRPLMKGKIGDRTTVFEFGGLRAISEPVPGYLLERAGGWFGSCEAGPNVPGMKCVRNEPGALLTQSRRIPFRPRHTRSSWHRTPPRFRLRLRHRGR